ncbi:ribbon-helix-helix protein, CopG family [Chishuiella sp.]|uniref:ribbon-helix-helix protein, CopG family n=1 Tax=Chishuiella sp. TaxID=1969467 RepID=UPI0028A921A1|nr:ribbon-helix-helix protein, CopG family [Chishuiella sp.]
MNTKETKKATSLRLNRGLYSKIEELAKKENRSISNLLETIISEALNYNEPNKETKEAIKELKEGKGVNFSSIDELFKSI